MMAARVAVRFKNVRCSAMLLLKLHTCRTARY